MAKNDAFLINHLGLVRVRVQGTGLLKVRAHSYEQVSTENLPDIVMVSPTDIIPTVLGNFKSQKIQIELSTEDIDDYMNFGAIVPFTKPTAASYPM